MIYLDNAATTKISSEVLQEMMPYLTEHYGNPSGVYALARTAHAALDKARAQIANAIHAQFAREVFFTGCGTESNNWAIKGTAFAHRDKGNHIVTSQIEHHAVLETCAFLERQGFSVTYLAPDAYGAISPESVRDALTPQTILVSVMHANNEIGTINPIKEIAQVVKTHGALFHTDAVQTAGHIPLDVQKLGVDYLSISGHKFHAPKGVGALYIKNGVSLEPLLNGGSQERQRRAGTENLASIVGMGAALTLANECMQQHGETMRIHRDHMVARLLEGYPTAKLNGHPTNRLPGNINISFPGVRAETLLFNLDLAGVAASGGSACTAGSIEESHVLKAIGLKKEHTKSTIRLTLSKYTTREEIDAAADIILGILRHI